MSNKTNNVILLENATAYLSDDEFMKLDENLSQNSIHLKSFENHGPRDSGILRIKASEDGQMIKKTKVFARGFFNHFDIKKPGKYTAKYNADECSLCRPQLLEICHLE